jgi:hypothetical protein
MKASDCFGRRSGFGLDICWHLCPSELAWLYRHWDPPTILRLACCQVTLDLWPPIYRMGCLRFATWVRPSPVAEKADGIVILKRHDLMGPAGDILVARYRHLSAKPPESYCPKFVRGRRRGEVRLPHELIALIPESVLKRPYKALRKVRIQGDLRALHAALTSAYRLRCFSNLTAAITSAVGI